MTTTTSDTSTDRLDRLEAAFVDLKAILDDPLQLINRLRELEIERRADPNGGRRKPA